ncbi:MAG TPA: site-specific integrase [Propionibacteriaceae bacterium]|nr:site-specific integrase [Propionibacteriaceae bacterium]
MAGRTAGGRARRNVNGEGNIRQRADGRWEARTYVITSDGREIRRSVYGRSWDEVHSALTRLQADRMLGRRVGGSAETMAEYLPRWLEDVAKARVRDTTYDGYEYLIRIYLVPEFGRYRLSRLQAADVRRGLQRLKGVCQCCRQGRDLARLARAEAEEARRAGRQPRKNARRIRGAVCCALTPPECCRDVLSDSTIQAMHRLLRTTLQDAVSDGLIADNVARNLRLVYPYQPRFRPWSAVAARQFLAASRYHRLAALFALALMTGLRRGEVLGLSWRDVDLDQGVIHVRQALHRVGGGLRLGPVKTSGSMRWVALPQPCVRALAEHRERQEVERHEAGDRWVETGLVFVATTGRPLDPANVNKAFASLIAEAGVPRIRFHDLRHSCATLLYELGVSIENIQDVLGHSTPVITKLLYVDGSEKVHRGAADRLGEVFE